MRNPVRVKRSSREIVIKTAACFIARCLFEVNEVFAAWPRNYCVEGERNVCICELKIASASGNFEQLIRRFAGLVIDAFGGELHSFSAKYSSNGWAKRKTAIKTSTSSSHARCADVRRRSRPDWTATSCQQIQTGNIKHFCLRRASKQFSF